MCVRIRRHSLRGHGAQRVVGTRTADQEATGAGATVFQASTNPRSVPRSSPHSSCTGAWHPRKNDTHKSVRTWLKNQKTKKKSSVMVVSFPPPPPHTPGYCQYERGPSAATATAYIGAGGLLGPGRKSAGRRGVVPAFILQDLMHGRFAGSRGDGVEGELEQRAGEGPLSCDSDDAAPARDIGRTQSRANGCVRTCSSRSCQEPQEGGRLGTPAATNLNSEYDEVASRRAR